MLVQNLTCIKSLYIFGDLCNLFPLVCMHDKSLQLYLTVCDTMDYRLPRSSVHGTSQARILSRLPFPSPGDLLHPGIEPTSLISPHWQEGSLPLMGSGKPFPLGLLIGNEGN